jgi:hypothetical protein
MDLGTAPRLTIIHEPNFHNISRFPGLLEESLQRPVQADIGKPTFTGNGFDPVLFFARGRIRTKEDIIRTVIVLIGGTSTP